MTDQASAPPFRCGYVAIVGRPNVGKSTLLNRLLGQKIAITSPKPQTTRHNILGIKTGDGYQTIYVDTPGMHVGGKRALNRYLNRAAAGVVSDVDVVVFMVDNRRWGEEDEFVLSRLKGLDVPVILAVNKVDQVKEKDWLLPRLQYLTKKHEFDEVVPLSAIKGDNVDVLERLINERLPESAPFFPEDQVTDRSERFLAAELIREKLMHKLGEELPYRLTVEVEEFSEDEGVLRIGAVILVERDSQKAIVIGKKGAMLKTVGKMARIEMQKVFDAKVYLRLWVKVKEGWSDDERALRSLGYE
jgi:GTP-binding protein Era